MEWSNIKILELIKSYRERPCLWDSSHPNNKISHKKKECWDEIAGLFDCSVFEVRRKMDSLLSSFRRERQKPKTKWFAFRSFLFLMDKFNERISQNITYVSSNEEMLTPKKVKIEKDIIDDDEEENDLDDYINDANSDCDLEKMYPNIEIEESGTKELKERKSESQTKSGLEDPRVETAYKILIDTFSKKRRLTATIERDESTVFGEFVAHKHRKYSKCTKSIVENLINNVLFEADMGKYDDPSALQQLTYSEESIGNSNI